MINRWMGDIALLISGKDRGGISAVCLGGCSSCRHGYGIRFSLRGQLQLVIAARWRTFCGSVDGECVVGDRVDCYHVLRVVTPPSQTARDPCTRRTAARANASVTRSENPGHWHACRSCVCIVTLALLGVVGAQMMRATQHRAFDQ